MAISALKELRKLARGLEGSEAFENLPLRLRREKSDRAAILMCASILDAGLKAGIAIKLQNKKVALSLFEDSGPLHHLGAKIQMAEAMDLFGPLTRKNLEIIQTVRNAFAHSLLVDSFATPEVATTCDALTLPPDFSERPPFLGRNKMRFDTHRGRFVTTCVWTSQWVILRGQEFDYSDGTRKPLPRLP